ncbi:imidazole glycerol phosphate synthase subunit HisF [Mariniblastus sp.]|mgnify:FL=1|jgi:cyclase|nr:imidazole glycerol phosphate synthase subunit HisF [Mariniblastus sp.]MDC0284945.1 imidazole glycerol phosphate synthase subunit HisF [Mariniblastus sp.]
MLKSRIIPCLDVNEGRVVKGVKFQNLRDAGDPVELSFHYQDQGADELVLLDVTATRQERIAMLETIERVRQRLSIPLTVGGGIGSIEDAGRLLNAGADKVSINSAAVRNPDLIAAMSARFGAQCTVVAIDAKKQGEIFQVLTRSGTTAEAIDAVAWAAQAESLGAGEILLTSFDRDGTRSGYDLPMLSAVTDACSLPVIASGGADSVAHMVEAFQHGAHAVLAASIFHDANMTVGEVKQQLTAAGIQVRNEW